MSLPSSSELNDIHRLRLARSVDDLDGPELFVGVLLVRFQRCRTPTLGRVNANRMPRANCRSDGRVSISVNCESRRPLMARKADSRNYRHRLSDTSGGLSFTCRLVGRAGMSIGQPGFPQSLLVSR